MKEFLKSWLINTLAVLVAVYVVPGIRFTDNSAVTPFITSLLLGILNAFIRPLMDLLALPLLILTLGLFRLVINALLLYLVGLLLSGYLKIDTFWAAFFGALVISVVSLFLNLLTGGTKAKIKVQRRGVKSGRQGPGGDGPIIDV